MQACLHVARDAQISAPPFEQWNASRVSAQPLLVYDPSAAMSEQTAQESKEIVPLRGTEHGVPQELVYTIVSHIAAPVQDADGRLIHRKDPQTVKDLLNLTMVHAFEAGSSRMLFGYLTIGSGDRTVAAFAALTKSSPRVSRSVVTLDIDFDDCDIYRSASIEDLETILANLTSLNKLRIHDSRGNTRPSMRRNTRKAKSTEATNRTLDKLTLSALDLDAVLEILPLFDSVVTLELEDIFCSPVPLFGLSEDFIPREIRVKDLRITGCHPAVAGILSKAVSTQYPVEEIGLYNISFALEYNALGNMLRSIGRDTTAIRLELTNRWARNPHSIHPKVLFSALADFWQLRMLHLYEDSDVAEDETEKLLFFCMIPHLPSDLHRFRLVLRFYKSVVKHLSSEALAFAIEKFLARYPRLSTFEITVDLREYNNPIDPAEEAREAVEQLKGMLSYVYRDRVSWVTACSPYYVDLTHHKISLGLI